MTTLVLLLLLGTPSSSRTLLDTHSAAPIDTQDLYPYGSPIFGSFVNESFRTPQGSTKFYRWLDKAYRLKARPFRDKPRLRLTDYLAFKARDIALTPDAAKRTAKERQFASGLFGVVKAVLPNFSLNKGFEFRNAVFKGQRQCFLQSVLISSMLQAGGVPAGVAMVNRNVEGQETNNKHAICFARLANGHDLIVDASEDLPFARQQGLFLGTVRGKRFVAPVYDSDSSIVAYRALGSNTTLAVDQIRPLNDSFIRSQFEYYRGEQTTGGVLVHRKTEGGMAAAAYHLEKSVAFCPDNPLATYMLGKVQVWEGQGRAARGTLERAMALYNRAGWVAPDERQALIQCERTGA